MSSLINVKKNELHLPNLAPNKENAINLAEKASTLKQDMAKIKHNFKPDPE
jgi:hypothetical protein